MANISTAGEDVSSVRARLMGLGSHTGHHCWAGERSGSRNRQRLLGVRNWRRESPAELIKAGLARDCPWYSRGAVRVRRARSSTRTAVSRLLPAEVVLTPPSRARSAQAPLIFQIRSE